jgi:hypothetical protein
VPLSAQPQREPLCVLQARVAARQLRVQFGANLSKRALVEQGAREDEVVGLCDLSGRQVGALHVPPHAAVLGLW